jgi:hypothetical protein
MLRVKSRTLGDDQQETVGRLKCNFLCNVSGPPRGKTCGAWRVTTPLLLYFMQFLTTCTLYLTHLRGTRRIAPAVNSTRNLCNRKAAVGLSRRPATAQQPHSGTYVRRRTRDWDFHTVSNNHTRLCNKATGELFSLLYMPFMKYRVSQPPRPCQRQKVTYML